ncbi:hypothetical protein Bca52824_024525 [Brassica carinata]|uniref:Uncharacterized protein n=1 Tax=Brassica carinata TaxID=52824 RepID=A0A8X8AVW0_BRACI|nr:hypothetical protein Bca52824_024525 [Brassica carinata]
MANSSILLAEGWPEMGSSSVLESRIGGFKSVKALETGVSKELQRLERHLQWPNVFDFGLNGGLLSRSCFGFMFVAMHAVKKRLRGSLTIYT